MEDLRRIGRRTGKDSEVEGGERWKRFGDDDDRDREGNKGDLRMRWVGELYDLMDRESDIGRLGCYIFMNIRLFWYEHEGFVKYYQKKYQINYDDIFIDIGSGFGKTTIHR